jgi:tetratricopeptide (TPR) repeat protein
VQAANFCAQNKVNLAEGMKWAERAVSNPYNGGQENFITLSTLARLQELNGQPEVAKKTFEKAINHRTAGPLEIHTAARAVLTDGKKEEAMRIWQLNAKRFPDQWPTHVGLMRGYSAMGDQKKALAEAKLALAQAPDDGNKRNLENLIKQLEQGKAVN